MVYRIYVEKKPELANEARALLSDANAFLGIKGLEKVRLINRYDVENITEELFDYAVGTVFSEPQLDMTSRELSVEGAAAVFAVEYLPGQFDQRADSAAQCIQIISQGERPTVRTAKVYALYGTLTDEQIAEIRKYVINPVEAREATLDMPETLKTTYAIPTEVETVEGFCDFSDEELMAYLKNAGLAMDGDDIRTCFYKTVDVTNWLVDHQMHVKDEIAVRTQCGNNRCAKADVRHKGTVHHVQMEIIGTCIGNLFDFRLQIGEISCQQRGCNVNHKQSFLARVQNACRILSK